MMSNILFTDIMYTMIIENKNETCDHNHLIAQKIDQDLQNCRKSCSERKNCKFFFINEDNLCGMYSSCSRRRAPTFAGTTFQKQVGNNSKLSYIYQAFILSGIESNFMF